MRLHNVAVVGATGMVGRKMLQILEERNFPVAALTLLASENSEGKEVNYGGQTHTVKRVTRNSFKDVEIALFSAGATVSKEFAPIAVEAGALVVDNSSAFRMDDRVPLVVPEVNRRMIFHHKGIIANPNCSTIQMVIALKPLHELWKIKRIVVSTYQSVTGAGQRGFDQLREEIANTKPTSKKFPHVIAYNVIPHIDILLEDGCTKEEYKMMHETKKIMDDDTIKVSATCVRVPVYGGHSESVNVEFEREFDLTDVRKALSVTKGIVLEDDPHNDLYPLPVRAWGKDEVFVGRLRRDESVTHGLNMWIVADNLRKGAATNAVQIMEEWLKGPGY
ncbi:MAG TPA: aspartate-semialdehyde dehydrogenase [Bacteroidota bacterium]